MHRTPWTKAFSSHPSDRIKPKFPPATASQTGKKRKGGHQQRRDGAPTRSIPVRKLEKLVTGLSKSQLDARDPKGGCFCLARMHDLSPYIPLCHACGLILCTLNSPYHACPHCTTPLLSDSLSPSSSRLLSRDILLAQVQAELESTIAEEQAQREHEEEQARTEAGSFPVLRAGGVFGSGSGSGSASSTPPHPSSSVLAPAARPRISAASAQPQTHKVMSLTPKLGNTRGRVIVSSYTIVSTPAVSQPDSRGSNADDLEVTTRVPTPVAVSADGVPKPCKERPWINYVHGLATYKPPGRLDDDVRSVGAGPSSSLRQRRGNMNKEKSKEGSVGTQW